MGNLAKTIHKNSSGSLFQISVSIAKIFLCGTKYKKYFYSRLLQTVQPLFLSPFTTLLLSSLSLKIQPSPRTSSSFKIYNNNNLFLRSRPSETPNWSMRLPCLWDKGPPRPRDLTTKVYIPYPYVNNKI